MYRRCADSRHWVLPRGSSIKKKHESWRRGGGGRKRKEKASSDEPSRKHRYERYDDDNEDEDEKKDSSGDHRAYDYPSPLKNASARFMGSVLFAKRSANAVPKEEVEEELATTS